MRLGIDFGTTRTVVAAAMGGRYPIAVFETPHGFAEFVPGLAVRGAGRLELGWEAAAGSPCTPTPWCARSSARSAPVRPTIAWASSVSKKRRSSSRRSTSCA